MKTFNIGERKLESNNKPIATSDEHSDIFEALNNKPVATYQMEGQNKKSFNWGFLIGVLLSSTFWIVVIYLAK